MTLLTDDSGAPIHYTIDLSWLQDVPKLEQDEQVRIEIEKLPDGTLVAGGGGGQGQFGAGGTGGDADSDGQGGGGSGGSGGKADTQTMPGAKGSPNMGNNTDGDANGVGGQGDGSGLASNGGFNGKLRESLRYLDEPVASSLRSVSQVVAAVR